MAIIGHIRTTREAAKDFIMKKYILLKALQLYLKKNKQHYNILGYRFVYEKNTIQITYNDSDKYIISIDEEDKTKYIKLCPYHESYFKTEISLKELKFKVNMTLFALKENEELHKL